MVGMTYGRRMGWVLCFTGLLLFLLSITAWGTCTTAWHSPSGNSGAGGSSWTNGPGGYTAYDNDRASATVNGEEHEYHSYGFALGSDIPADATIVGFEVRIRGYSVAGGGSVAVGLSPDGGTTVDMPSGVPPWIIYLPEGSDNEGWNSVVIDNPPFIHTFTPAEVCNNNFTVWVKANVGGTAIYVDAVEVRVTYYDEIVFPWNPDNPTSVSSTTHNAGVWYNANTLPPEGTTVTLQWNSATDRPTCDSGIDGYRIYWDSSSSTNLGASDGYFVDEDGAHTQDFTLGNGQYWFHIRSVDNVGHLADSTDHYGPYQYDDTWPTNPNVTSSRATDTWLNSADVPISVNGAIDTPSGVDGFETAWTHSASWTHTATKNREESWTGETFTLPNDGVWYFHLATVDNAGNWVPTSVYETEGWFGVDTHAPTDPTVTSPTHAEGSVSSNPNVQIDVSGATDPQYGESGYENSSGVYGFSVAWDGSAVNPPDAVVDHEQDWTGATYALADGTWYFHLRTEDNAGNWTSTEDYGPVTIDTTPPNAPSITGIADDNGSSGTDAITNDNTLMISGTAEANSTVEVFRDSASIGTTPADGSGNWTFDYTGTQLSDGSYSFTATATDAAGSVSEVSSPLSVLIDTQAPPTPGGRTPADGTYTNDNTPAFSWSGPTDPGGSGVRDYHIIIYDSTHNQVKTSYPTNTQYTPTALADDTYTWKLATRDVAGNTGEWGDEWALVVDTEVPTCTVSVGTATIYDGDLVQEVTIDYSEEMKHVADAPTIEFTGTAGIWSSNGNGAWDANYDQWTESFTITDAGENVTATVTASGAEDLAGNTQVSNQTTFAVDTENPTITSITSTTPDGYYNVGANINVTVSFSEPVTLTGGTFDVTLDTPGDVVSLAEFGPVTSSFTTYTIGAGDNSCDLDAINVALNGGTLRDNAGNDAVIALPATTIADGSDIVVDTTAPVITGLDLPDTEQSVDSGCSITIPYSAVVTDNCCVNASNVTVVVEFASGAGTATLNAPAATITNQGGSPNTQVNVSGSFTVSDLTAGDVVIRVRINGIDCAGNAATQASDVVTIVDSTNPVIVWNTELPDSPQYVDSTLCSIAIPIQATVTDNCCILAANVSVDISVTNATLEHTVTVTQAGDTVVVAGLITVSCLTGCPAVLSVAIDATDCCGNDATQLTDSVQIYDNTIPVINDLAFYTDDTYTTTTNDYHVNDCCLTTVYFAANVTDQCCVHPNGVTVDVTLPTNNGVLENIVVNKVEASECPGLVNITGSADVRCLTSYPARVEVHIEATDCCGNDAVPVTSATSEGLVYDVTPPVALDDPNGDENRSVSDNLEVRLDEYGQYRLMLREDTPTRIDVIANDSDNCSLCTCCGTMWIYDIVSPPQYGTATIEIDHGDCNGGSSIRYAPYKDYTGKDQFTYRIVDACGNVSSTATIYLEVVRQTVMDDICLTTCTDTPVSFDVKATDLWINPMNPGEIPFVFSIFTPPMHGVVSGDLGDVTYSPPGATTAQIESATITLVYTPAAGFTGRDVLTLQFSDPFGGSSTAVADIAVTECTGQPGAPPLLVQQGETLPLIVPLTFATVYETAWETVTLIGVADGTAYQGALSATWEESIGRYVLRVDTASLPVGLYRMTIPLGNGETVTLMIEVGEAE